MNILKDIIITPNSVTLDGEPMLVNETGEALLVSLYRESVGDYPKFFKMDGLCRLGFIASELLLRDEPNRFKERDDRAVIIANRYASIKNDRAYEATMVDYPSPALFVYTLPNVVTGEIAIRNRYMGETSCYILDSELEMLKLVEISLTGKTTSALFGRVEMPEDSNYYAHLTLVERDKWKI